MKTIHPTPYPELNQVLQALADSAGAILQDNLLGLYLHGSFATGDFDEHSDVDFLAIIEQDLIDTELAAVQKMHQRLFALPIPWAQHLEGSYFPQAMLKRYDPVADRPFYIDNSSETLVRHDHDNTWVVRWTVRAHGIPLLGPPAPELIDPIPAGALHEEIVKTMQDWGAEIVAGKYSLASRWAQPFAALSYGRMLHTLATGQIHSKLAAVAWAETHLDERWVGLLKRAWAERPFPGQKVHQTADPIEVDETIAFIHFATNHWVKNES
jgi:streptomycin 3"-adenylyltransferase